MREADVNQSRLKDEIYLSWWGLLRRPPIHLELELSRRDTVVLAAVVGLVLAFVWAVICMLLGPTAPVLGIDGLVAGGGVVAVVFVTLVLAVAIPPQWFAESWFGDVLLAQREGRGLVGVDIGIVLAGLVVVALLAALGVGAFVSGSFAFASEATAAAVFVCALLSVAVTFLLRVLPEPVFVARGRTTRIPEWLRRWLDREERDETGKIASPDPDATFEYPFPSGEGEVGRVGVRVADELLAILRQLNTENDGRLYQKDEYKGTLAVVHGTNPPVRGNGVPQLQRLTAQVLQMVRESNATPFQSASQILTFVQRNIAYEFDEVGTERILGQAFEEYGRFPLETLVDGVGDCECTALLCAAMLSYAGFPCALLLVVLEATPFEKEQYHMAIGLLVDSRTMPPISEAGVANLDFIEHKGRRYLYGETASDALSPEGFGVVPSCWKGRMRVERIVEVPALTFH